MKPVTRRTALTTLGATGAALALGACAPQNRNPGAALASANAGVRVGAVADFPTVGSFKETELADTPAVIVRLERANPAGISVGDVHLIALSRVCTHLGCLVNAPRDGVLGCACHGSLFSAAGGAATRGPATESLATFKLEARADGIYAVG
jgi:Rieske Fe-S protein